VYMSSRAAVKGLASSVSTLGARGGPARESGNEEVPPGRAYIL